MLTSILCSRRVFRFDLPTGAKSRITHRVQEAHRIQQPTRHRPAATGHRPAATGNRPASKQASGNRPPGTGQRPAADHRPAATGQRQQGTSNRPPGTGQRANRPASKQTSGNRPARRRTPDHPRRPPARGGPTIYDDQQADVTYIVGPPLAGGLFARWPVTAVLFARWPVCSLTYYRWPVYSLARLLAGLFAR